MIVNKTLSGKVLAGFLLVFLSGLTGCDQIYSIFEKSANKNNKNVESIPVQKFPDTAKTEKIQSPSQSTSETLPDNIVARVGNWSITIDEFNGKLAKLKEILPEFDPTDVNSKKLILEELVRQELLVKDAEDIGVGKDKEILETVEDFRKTLLVQEVATQLTKDVKVTEEEAKDYYEKNKSDFNVKTEWKVREIVVPSEAEANEILVQVLQGGNFSAIAKEKSQSPTAAKSGDMGWVEKFPFEQMRAAVTALEKEKTSGVFKGPSGYYIVKLEDKRGGAPKPFLAMKSDLIKRLTLAKQQEAVLDHLNELAAKTKIQVNEELLK